MKNKNTLTQYYQIKLKKKTELYLEKNKTKPKPNTTVLQKHLLSTDSSNQNWF